MAELHGIELTRMPGHVAIVMDGKWYERGEMGWWGMVSNEQDTDAWNAQVSTLLDSLPDDTDISVVDCHI